MAYSFVAEGTQFLSNILNSVSKKKRPADNISWSSIWTHNVHGKGCLCQTAGLKVERHKLFTLFLSITNKMQRYTIFFITLNAQHVSGGFSAHHQELKTVHTASGICQACLLLPLAVAASKLDIYPMLCVQYWAPDDGRRNRLKHVGHWE